MKQFIGFLFVCVLTACQPNQNQTHEMEPLPNTNAVVENILNRRSIRSYKAEQVSDAQLDTLIRCAIHAPSALNKQPWEVRIIQSPELLQAINAGFVRYAEGKNLPGSASKAHTQGFSVFHGAPTLLVIAADEKNAYSAVDCGLMGQNVLLAAQSMQLGTCVVGSVVAFLNTPEAASLVSSLNLPEGYRLLYTIAVGYPNESPEAKPRDASKVQVIR